MASGALCPHCERPLEGLGTYCHTCNVYVDDLRRNVGGAVLLTLPLPPNMANGRMHWRAKNRKRQEYLAMCDAWESGSPLRLTKARMTPRLYVWSKMDVDNAMARLKWPVDWLVRRGYLPDDNPDHLEWSIPKQIIDRKRQRIEIILEAA